MMPSAQLWFEVVLMQSMAANQTIRLGVQHPPTLHLHAWKAQQGCSLLTLKCAFSASMDSLLMREYRSSRWSKWRPYRRDCMWAQPTQTYTGYQHLNILSVSQGGSSNHRRNTVQARDIPWLVGRMHGLLHLPARTGGQKLIHCAPTCSVGLVASIFMATDWPLVALSTA
jgi:hypothetical protein